MYITETTFEINTNGMVLRGTELRPEGENLPIAIISHGFMGCQRDTCGYAKKFAEWGYAAYCFDFIGGGTNILSDGELKDMTVLTEKSDLLAVTEFAANKPYTNAEKITLMGFSQGGFVSAMAASELKSTVDRLILVYPAFCIPDDARKGSMQMFQFDPENIPDEISGGGIILGGDYPRAVKDMNPYKEISGFNGEVLIIHGDSDGLVPLSYSQKAQECYGERCKLIVIVGAGHGFNESEDIICTNAIKEFLPL